MNLCLSGGAKGSDAAWGAAALAASHDVIHWSFDGHKSFDPAHTFELTSKQLKEADERLFIARKSIKRSWPTQSVFVNNLLRRNWYQVATCESVYAVSILINDDESFMKVKGGTAWALQLYVDRAGKDAKIWLFDQKQEKWFKWNINHWIEEQIIYIPIPSGVYAGIGTRELNDAGLKAIRSVF